MADIKPIKPIKLCVNITIPTIDDDSISLYECVGILGNKLQEAIQKINESLGSLEGAYTADNPPPYPVTSVNGKTGAVVIDIPANVYTEDNPPPYPVTSVNRAETKDVITVFEPEGGSIEDVSQAELIAACKAGARLGAFNQDNGTCRLYHFNLYVDPERVDYKEVAGGGTSGVTSVNNQTGQVNIFNAPISAATAESVTALNTSTNTKINQLKSDKANKADVLTLEEIQASTDLSGKIASASALKTIFDVTNLSINVPYNNFGKDNFIKNCKYISSLIEPYKPRMLVIDNSGRGLVIGYTYEQSENTAYAQYLYYTIGDNKLFFVNCYNSVWSVHEFSGVEL